MKVTKKPTMRQYELLLTEDDLRQAILDGTGFISNGNLFKRFETLHVSHVDTAPNDDECLVRICITEVAA
jgi:hypothetical protein|tara:strand:- start:389 stop:598 length:210 start_codon:yes stop_codon:yes gene_type:complete